jgi:hypothetical protein
VRFLNALEREAQTFGGAARAQVERVALPLHAARSEFEGVLEHQEDGLCVRARPLRDRAVPDPAKLDLQVLGEVRLIVGDAEALPGAGIRDAQAQPVGCGDQRAQVVGETCAARRSSTSSSILGPSFGTGGS